MDRDVDLRDGVTFGATAESGADLRFEGSAGRPRQCEPADDRDFTLKCALAGLSYAEYAERSDLHPAAVKSRAYRARRRLRELLREEDETRGTPA